MKDFLPRNDEHTAIVGRNGSGKSQAGAWLISKKDLKREAWTIIDYKNEEIFEHVQNARDIGFGEIPKEPGLYVLKSRPDLWEHTEAHMWKLWNVQRNAKIPRMTRGFFVDEGYMLPQIRDGAFQALLTQGRALRIPVITLTQRPVRVEPFAFSEASHILVFDLNRKKDWQTIDDNTVDGFSTWLPDGLPEMPPFHSRWFHGKTKGRHVLKPVPSADEIISAIDVQLEKKARWF